MRVLKPGRGLRSPSVVRTVSVSLAVVLSVIAFVSTKRSVRASYASGINVAEAAVHGGLLEFGWVDGSTGVSPPASVRPSFSFDVQREWNDSLSLAWRPYRVRQTRWPSNAKYHALAIPLWLLVFPSLVLAGYAQGVVAGLHRGRKGFCTVCGYLRTGLAPEAACPECGSTPTSS